ncbi:hypothetical protein NEOKW01_1163 [Nematocida sp. AWRm80]|nr:hypothetical protein NEOKW01_1163 [Nematocida sp. AWRm80]
MLVEIEYVSIRNRGMLGWASQTPSYQLCIREGSEESDWIKVRKRSHCRLGVVYEVCSLNNLRIVVKVKDGLLEVPININTTTIPFKFKGCKGSIELRIHNKCYFAVHEEMHGGSVSVEGEFSRNQSVVSNSILVRKLYNNENYTVDLDKLETTDYAPILRDPIVSEAHKRSRELAADLEKSIKSEDALFLKKVRTLRTSPTMFITIFLHTILEVSRLAIIESLFQVFSDPRSRSQLKRKLTIKFLGELGEDHGALRKEFFEIAAHDLMQDSRFTVVDGLIDLTPDLEVERIRASGQFKAVLNVADDMFYSFTGFFLGYIVFQQLQVQTRFAPALYMNILKKECKYEDLPDNAFKKSIEWIMNNDIDEEEYVLKSGARVTNKNKNQFIKELIHEEVFGTKSGYKRVIIEFHKIVSKEVFDFTPEELSRLISGIPIIPLEYLKSICIYKRCTTATKEIVFFWNILDEETEEYRRNIIRFITGSSSLQCLPGGLNESIIIERIDTPGYLPTAHACFRRLVLYSYQSQNELKEKLTYAFQESGGFHFI